jgi:hypothetical protein
MTRYLLSIYEPDTEPPVTGDQAQIMRDLDALEQEAKDAGAWLFSAGLRRPSTASVVRADGDTFVITDGPFIETKEHIGGFMVVEAPDLDSARDWAGKLSRAATLPVEVRPVEGDTPASEA